MSAQPPIRPKQRMLRACAGPSALTTGSRLSAQPSRACRRCCVNGWPTVRPQVCRRLIFPWRRSAMNNNEIRSLYGLKYHPFVPDVPVEALSTIPGTEPFTLRVQTMAALVGSIYIVPRSIPGTSSINKTIEFKSSFVISSSFFAKNML